MTDLIHRPSSRSGTRTTARSQARGRGRAGAAAGDPGPRSLAAGALIAGLATASITLVIAMSAAITGWFLADAGSHGDTTDALRVGSVAWLMGHGSRLVFSGAPLGIVPLGLTLVLLVALFRGGSWAGRTSAPAEDARALGTALTMLVSAYVVVTVLVCVLASESGATPVLGRAIIGSALVATIGGGSGLVSSTGWLDDWLTHVPAWARQSAYGALVAVAALVAAASVTLGVSLLVHLNDAATIIAGLDLTPGSALTFTLVVALLAPNCVLLATSYLIGPGFAVGTGTVVSPTAVALGPVPALPVLAAAPNNGPGPGWAVVLLAVPALAAGLGAALAQRRSGNRAYDLGALRGAGVGFLAGVLVTLLIALAGGPMGTGRLADIGAPATEVLVTAVGGMGLGGLVGGLAMTWWQRRGSGAG